MEQADLEQENTLSPYMGGHVEIVEMSNGAVLNKKLSEFYSGSIEPKIKKIQEGIVVLQDFALENTVIIEGDTGVIVWDTGLNMGTARSKYQALRKLTSKSVSAIIYSHNHYTKGAKAFVENEKNPEKVQIFAHPDVHRNMLATTIELGETSAKATAQHFGMYLPRTGPDAPPIAFEGKQNEDKSSGYLKPTYEVSDEEELVIDGVKMQFFYTPSDTYDSLTVWLPDYDTVITNSLWNLLPNIYTLRGQPFRNPKDWLEGIDKIRKINPQYVIPEHGNPTTDRKLSYEYATVYRDVLAFIYSQTVRGINRGLKPDEIAENVRLPKHLQNHPQLAEVYGEFKHHIKGVYNGLIGWFSLDAADISPVTNDFRSKKIIEGFGGREFVIEAVEQALTKSEYAWAAELVTHILNIEQDDQEARKLKAEALRKMGYRTPALSSRGFYLSQALALEGKIDLNQIPNGMPKTFEQVVDKLPIESTLKLLEFKISPEKSKNINALLSITFSDLKQTYGLYVRRGIAEYVKQVLEDPDLSISLSRQVWVDFLLAKANIHELIERGEIEVTGNKDQLIEFMQVFEF